MTQPATLVSCQICGATPRNPQEIETSPDGKWTCPSHLNPRYTLNLLDFIKARITVNQTQDEDRSKFVLRELVQNADDAEASILVLRFEPDALYVANDDRAFSVDVTSGTPNDFDRISNVLRQYKAEEKESAGHFGSGFQTVYSVTNRPEVHSNGASRALDPVEGTWDDKISHRHSPYIGAPQGHKGVLFRLPWRDEAGAMEVSAGITPFADENSWPRWDIGSIQALYDECEKYLGSVILCCQRLRTVRIVWTFDGITRAFQAVRDYQLDDRLERPAVLSISEEEIGNDPDFYKWDGGMGESSSCPPSFDRSKGRANSSRTLRSYPGLSCVISDKDGVELHLVKGVDGRLKIAHSIQPHEKEIKKNNAHILFPLFVTDRQFLYSIIPLPARSANRFAFSINLIPTPDRMDVDVQGNLGVSGDWYRCCMNSVVDLFRDGLLALRGYLRQTSLSVEEKQFQMLQAVPVSDVGKWMRPGHDDQSDWARQATETVRNWLLEQDILLTDEGDWISPRSGYATKTDLEKRVLAELGMAAVSQNIISKIEGISWLKTKIEAHRFSQEMFTRAWKEMLELNKPHNPKYEGPVKIPARGHDLILSSLVLKDVIEYALSATPSLEVKSLPLIPNVTGRLGALSDFVSVPTEVNGVENLLDPSHRIHADFVHLIEQIETEHPLRRQIAVANLPALISEAVAQQHDRFSDVSKQDHARLSDAVAKIVLHPSFAPATSENCDFLPYRREGKIQVGPPPDVQDSAKHVGENYSRDWIFVRKSISVHGMSPEIEAKIRFLDLIGIPDETIEQVRKKLNIVALAEVAGRQTNFVRHFVSDLNKSLFNDVELSSFLGNHDAEFLTSQKTRLLKAVRAYFDKPRTEDHLTREDMGEIPCVYDEHGDWHKAKEFALGKSLLVSLLEFRTLHADFADWPTATLEAIGCVKAVDPDYFVNQVKSFVANPGANRSQLLDLFGALIVAYEEASLPEIGSKLSGVAWIPVGLEGIATIAGALLPTEENLSILGSRSDQFIGMKRMSPHVLESLGKVETVHLKRRSSLLGMRPGPSIDEMLNLVRLYADSLLEPPPRLFEELSRSLQQANQQERIQYRQRMIGMKFWKGRWYAGRDIRLLVVPVTMPIPLKAAGILSLSNEESEPFQAYLWLIGAIAGLDARDYLLSLAAVAETAKRVPSRRDELASTHDSLWALLDSMIDNISQTDCADFRSKALLAVGSGWYSPETLVFDERGVSETPVSFGITCVLPSSFPHKKALQRLGVMTLSLLGNEAAKIFLEQSTRTDVLDESRAEVYLQILLIGIERRWWSGRESLSWPVKKENSLSFRRPSDCFIANSAMTKSIPKISILLTSCRNRFHDELETLAREWGGRDMHDTFNFVDLKLENRNRALEIEELFFDVLSALNTLFPAERRNLAWLRAAQVFRSDESFPKFSIGNYQGSLSLPVLVPAGPSRIAMILPREQLAVDQRVADQVAEWAAGVGFPREKLDTLAKTILLICQNPLLADSSDEIQKSQTPGYVDTVRTLSSWYVGCEICGWRTPRDQMSGQSLEKVKSIISELGGMFYGKMIKYEVGNCLYLCPRHSILIERGLIRLPFMEGWDKEPVRIASNIQSYVSNIPDDGSDFPLTVEVFEWKELSPTKRWRKSNLTIRSDHARALLGRLVAHVEQSRPR